jgi:hypothetical protein
VRNARVAASILRTLAEGFDPKSGEDLAEGGPLSDPDVIRALLAGARALDGPPRVLPEGAGRPWDKEEEDRLVEAFDAGSDVAALAEGHGRTRGAIVSRLLRLGRDSAVRGAAASPESTDVAE